MNELTTLTEPGSPGPQTSFGYDANHHRTTTTYPGNTVQTVTYDNAQRLSAISAVNGATTLTNFTCSFTKPGTPAIDTTLVYTTTNTFDALNRLTTWAQTVPTGSTLAAHDYLYHYDGNGNRTYIIADGTVTNLFYNAVNEWYQSTVPGITNPNTLYWDAAGNMLGNNDFGGGPHPQTISYNAKNQLASITGGSAMVCWYVILLVRKNESGKRAPEDQTKNCRHGGSRHARGDRYLHSGARRNGSKSGRR